MELIQVLKPPEGCKDLNDLHRRDPEGFEAAFRAMMEAAEALSIPEDGPPLEFRAASVGNLIGTVKAQIAANVKRGRLGIRTGFKYLDSTIEGYQPGHLWAIVGYTSRGKTAKAVQMVVNVLELEPDAVVAFFSLEMTNTGNILRLAACRCGIPALATLKGNWTPADRARSRPPSHGWPRGSSTSSTR